jgi:predicted transcriptional regulator
VNKETHKKLSQLASLTHRTRANTVEWLVDRAINQIQKAEKNGGAEHIKFGL